ncbi:MAG TPA: TPM domain-containing protein [Polyangia bacterium]|nr:TPM domain-containing protein [Polyangia bacterium]
MRVSTRARLLTAGIALTALLAGATARAATAIADAPARWVSDHAGFLSPAATNELEGRLGAYADRTGHQLLVYIDHTTGGDPIDDWAVRAFQHWKVGRKGIDDGLVLFIFSDDHHLRIEVGYGLEASVPDALASRIINERMVPQIRAGDRDGAVRSGVDALVAAIGAPPGADAGAPAPHIPTWKLVMGGILLLLFIGFALTHPGLAWLMLMSIGSGRGGGGGGGGGGFSGGGGSSGGGGASGSW